MVEMKREHSAIFLGGRLAATPVVAPRTRPGAPVADSKGDSRRMFPNVMCRPRTAVETSGPSRSDGQGQLPMARMRHWHGVSVALLVLALAVVAPVVAAKAATLDDIRARKTVRVGVRADAPPFSFTGPDGAPA